MASTSPILPIFLSLTTFLIITTPHHLARAATPSKTPAATPVAPGPTPAPLNLTAILEKGGQYNTLMRLLKDTQIGEQIQSQLNNSYGGLTLFAPTDNAFNNLKPGTLNSLTAQDQVSLVLYHVLPRYYSMAMFQTSSNPVRTQATGNDGIYTLNITSTSSQVNVSTGIDETQVNTPLYTTFPFAVYSVDKVLLPYDLFGAKPPASAPPPAPAPKAAKKSPAAPSEAVTSPSAASFKGRSVGWSLVVGVGLMCIGSLL